jgi:hypothetical protein
MEYNKKGKELQTEREHSEKKIGAGHVSALLKMTPRERLGAGFIRKLPVSSSRASLLVSARNSIENSSQTSIEHTRNSSNFPNIRKNMNFDSERQLPSYLGSERSSINVHSPENVN